MPLPSLVQAMLDPSFYRPRPSRVELRQTHISFVLIAGDEVYKLKKPVRFTFLDFSTLELRRRCCLEEVRLNRRLAADVYLGVVSLCPDGEGFRIGDEDDPAAVEYAVHMRRLPDEQTLEHRLGRDVGETEIERVAAALVDFHRAADCGDDVSANGTPAAILRFLQDNYDGVVPFRGVTIDADDDDAIQKFARDFLRDNQELLQRRREQRRIRDGHGDLHLDHVYLTEPLRIVDCVEFNSRFRWCDVASDIAFLFMDLEFHGRADLAAHAIDHYVALSGDDELRRLLPFYACYRAYVRGKVDSLKSAEEEIEPEERELARADAHRHFELSYRYTWGYTPALVVVAGLSGSGKSTVARALSARTGFALLASDEVRKQLAGLEPTARPDGRERDRLYSAEMSRRTYAALFARARRELEAGHGVILDATFQQRGGRLEARELAAETGGRFVLVECRADDATVRRRLRERNRRNDDASDADWAVYLEQKRLADPFDEERIVMEGETPDVREVERALRKD